MASELLPSVPKYRWLLAIALLSTLNLPFSAMSGQEEWKTFTSSRGFTVIYPSTWTLIGEVSTHLHILSLNKGQEGVVIAENESEITVDEMSVPPIGKFPDSIENYYHLSIYDFRSLQINEGIDGAACHNVNIGNYDFDVAPNVFQVHTTLTCPIGARWFEVQLIRWKDDGRSAEHEEIALKMMKSLRVAGP
jgi:hypothetical protein